MTPSNDALKQAALTFAGTKPLKLGQIIQLTARGSGGVTNASGIALDGDANNTPGCDFVWSLGTGTKLSSIDSNGDTVALSLAKGGLMELALPMTPAGNPTLRLTGTVASTSTLTGSVKKPKTGGGDGRTSLAALTGSAGVIRTGLPICSPTVSSNCFTISSSSSIVVDLLLESDGL